MLKFYIGNPWNLAEFLQQHAIVQQQQNQVDQQRPARGIAVGGPAAAPRYRANNLNNYEPYEEDESSR